MVDLSGAVLAGLREVYDPELPVNIVDLGLVYDVAVDEAGFARVTMTLTSPNCAAAGTIPVMVKARALRVEGVTGAEVEVTWEPPWTKDRMSMAARLALNL